MHKAKHFILLAVVICALLASGLFIYNGWVTSRQVVVAYTQTSLVQEGQTVPGEESEPTPAPREPAPPSIPVPKPAPVPQPVPNTSTPIKRVELPSRNSVSNHKALLQHELNPYVLSVIQTYSFGSYPYLLNTDYANYNGVTEDIVYNDTILLRAHPSGNKASHCSGITFEVFFKAMQERNIDAGISTSDFNGMTFEQLQDFMLTWYVANGPKTVSNIAVAVEKYGLGKQIHQLEQAKPGDFVDISRENRTGHTVVLINWILKDGNIIGLKYWSSQRSTNGIGYKSEYFNVPDVNGVPYGNVHIDQVYIARVGPISEYKR